MTTGADWDSDDTDGFGFETDCSGWQPKLNRSIARILEYVKRGAGVCIKYKTGIDY